MDNSRGPGRPLGGLKGATAEANELAVFLRQVTKDQTVRRLAVRYMGGRTAWSLYRSGAQVVPLHLLEQVVRDRVPDQAGRTALLAHARSLHQRATAAAVPESPPDLAPELPESLPVTESASSPAAPPMPSPEPSIEAPARRSRWLSHAAVAAVAVVVAVTATLVVAHTVQPQASTKSGTSAPEPAQVTEALVAVTPSGDAVNSWDPKSGRWTEIGGPAAEVHGGGAGLFAVAPGVGHIAHYRAPGNWSYIGERPAELAVGRDHLYRLAPDRAAVWAWVAQSGSWLLIGGPARHIHAGQSGLYATDPTGHKLFRYEGTPGNWTWLTDTVDPEDRIVVGRETLYRLTADRSAVHEWNPADASWSRIGGPAKSVHAGGAGLFLVDQAGVLHAYQGKPDAWQPIGDAGTNVAVAPDRVYRAGPDGTVSQWSGGVWTDLDGRGSLITATGR